MPQGDSREESHSTPTGSEREKRRYSSGCVETVTTTITTTNKKIEIIIMRYFMYSLAKEFPNS